MKLKDFKYFSELREREKERAINSKVHQEPKSVFRLVSKKVFFCFANFSQTFLSLPSCASRKLKTFLSHSLLEEQKQVKIKSFSLTFVFRAIASKCVY
jgi:hypothetical protein